MDVYIDGREMAMEMVTVPPIHSDENTAISRCCGCQKEHYNTSRQQSLTSRGVGLVVCAQGEQSSNARLESFNSRAPSASVLTPCNF